MFFELTVMKNKKLRWARRVLAQTVKLVVASILVLEVAAANTAVLDAHTSQYMVSAVLRKGNDGLAIRLVHAVTVGRSAEEAMGDFLKKVMVEFPEYSVMDIISAPIPSPCRRPSSSYAST